MDSGDASAANAPAHDLQGAVGERIDGLTSWCVRFWAPIVLGLIMLGDSWDSIVIAYVVPSLKQEWGLDTIAIGAMISAGYAGQFVGSLLLGPLAEKFGRMPIFYVAIAAMCMFTLGCALSHDPQLFLTLRFCAGFSLGGALPVCISYVNELAPTKTRGRYFSLFQFIMVSGYALVSITAPFIIPAHGWRTMFFIGAFPVLLIPLVMLTLPESPRWLARYGRVAKANRALAKLGAAAVDENLPIGGAEARRVPVLALFAPEYRMRTIVVSALWFFTSLVSFAFATWAPTLYTQVYHLPLEEGLRYTAIAGALYLFVPLAFAALIDIVGRRGPAIFVNSVALLALIALIAISQPQTLTVATLITTGWIAAAAGSVILWPYTAEIFPTQMRATGVGLSSSLARGASMLTPLVVAGTLAYGGSVRVVFAMLGVCSLIVILLWVFFTRETARKSLEETGGR